MKKFIVLSLLILLSSCASQTELDKTKKYKMEMYLTSNGHEALGMLALPKAAEYPIYMIGEEKINLLSFRSCSREEIIEDPKSWMNKKKFFYRYVPNEIEKGPSCGVIISAINKEGMFSSGYIDFQDDTTTLPAINICGDTVEKTNGVNVCQSRKESMQRIRFEVEVAMKTSLDCEWERVPNRGKEFSYNVKLGDCSYAFVETKPPYRKARLSTFGYDDIQVKL